MKKIDGTKLFGFVEMTADHTIRITSDSGIIRLPIAQLGDADFQKYGFQKDRSKDGRFWYERKEALKDSKEDPKSEKEAFGEKSIAEIRLAEISAFQPFIAAYEKTLAPKSTEKASTTSKPEETPDTSSRSVKPMFSQPSLGGPLPETLQGLGNSGVQSVTDAFGLPSSP